MPRARHLALAFVSLLGVAAAAACSSTSPPGASAAPCSTDDDCSSGTFCTWPTTSACGARGTCQAPPADQTACGTPTRACPCDGTAMLSVACGQAPQAVTGTGGCENYPCTPGQTTCNAGLSCQGSFCLPAFDGGAAMSDGGSDAAPAASDASGG